MDSQVSNLAEMEHGGIRKIPASLRVGFNRETGDRSFVNNTVEQNGFAYYFNQ